MQDNIYYIYLHINPVTKEPFYVGKGKGNRYKNIQFRSNNWKEGAKQGVEFKILVNNLKEDEAYEEEKYWVSIYGRKDLGNGGRLSNMTNGGRGNQSYYLKYRKEIEYTEDIIYTEDCMYFPDNKVKKFWVNPNIENKREAFNMKVKVLSNNRKLYYLNLIEDFISNELFNYKNKVTYNNIAIYCNTRPSVISMYLTEEHKNIIENFNKKYRVVNLIDSYLSNYKIENKITLQKIATNLGYDISTIQINLTEDQKSIIKNINSKFGIGYTIHKYLEDNKEKFIEKVTQEKISVVMEIPLSTLKLHITDESRKLIKEINKKLKILWK